MSRLTAVITILSSLLCGGELRAQNLVIANARILTGTGAVIEQGSIVVRDGRIVSVAAGGSGVPGTQVIDARGMTALPGFIDAHRHIINGDDDRWF
jgi:imidazolonepropionase-like amidohydrolase